MIDERLIIAIVMTITIVHCLISMLAASRLYHGIWLGTIRPKMVAAGEDHRFQEFAHWSAESDRARRLLGLFCFSPFHWPAIFSYRVRNP